MNQMAENDLRLVLGEEVDVMEALVRSLMSPGNKERGEAEALYNLSKERDPDTVTLKLGFIIQQSAAQEVRAMAALLLQRLLTRDDSSFLWPRLSSPAQISLKDILLSSIQSETAPLVFKKLCGAISELASVLLPENGWPNFLPFLLSCLSSDSPKLQESSFLILARLSGNVGDILIPYVQNLHALFLNALSSSASFDVNVAALYAFREVIPRIPVSDYESFQDLLQHVMRTLNEAIRTGNDATAQEVLEILMELAEEAPLFLSFQLLDILDFVLRVAEANGVQEGTRHLAVEFVITIAEARKAVSGVLNKHPQFTFRSLAVLMGMVSDVDDDPDWHSAMKEDEEEEEENSNCNIGLYGLDRLARSLGGSTIIPMAADIFRAYLASSEWTKHHAVLLAISQIAGGCTEVMIENMEPIVSQILVSSSHLHPRVRWAAIIAIQQLSEELRPDFQQKNHQSILPTLASALGDSQNPRIQAHAAVALSHFVSDCTRDVLSKYAERIVTTLLTLLQSVTPVVQVASSKALTALAGSYKDCFDERYDFIMPLLRFTMINATDRIVRANLMECMATVGTTVTKEKFRGDAQLVFEVLKSLQLSRTEDDPANGIILRVWAALYKCFEEEFLPCINIMMPPLLESARLRPYEPRDGVVRTSVLKEKARACHTLHWFAYRLGKNFFPWVDEAAATLVPLLKFDYGDDVKESSVLAMPLLLRCAKLAVDGGCAAGRDESYVKHLSDCIIPALIEAFHKDRRIKMSLLVVTALDGCLQYSGALVDENQVRLIVEVLKAVIAADSAQRRARALRIEEGGALGHEENEQNESASCRAGETVITLMKTFGAAFLPFFDQMISYIVSTFVNEGTWKERRSVICIFERVVECREYAHKYYDIFLPLVIESCYDGSPEVRQAAAHAIGVSAELGFTVFGKFANAAVSSLCAVIQRFVAANSEEKNRQIGAHDRAVGALGKICMFHGGIIKSGEVIPAWLSRLPIKADVDQAKLVHEQLCLMLETSEGELLGPNYQNLRQILSIFAEVLLGKAISTRTTEFKIIKLLDHFRRTLPPHVFDSTRSFLSMGHQMALISYLPRPPPHTNFHSM